MSRYRCPKCSATTEPPIRPVGLPVCDGGRIKPHLACNMLLVEGEPPKSNPNHKGSNTMSKKNATPDKICGCYSEPVPGKPGVFQTCGRLTTSRFAPGHDAKLKGRLIAAAVANESFQTLDDGKVTKHDPATLAETLGWSKYIDRAIEVRDEKAAKATKRAEEAAAAEAAGAEGKAAADAAKAADKEAKAAERAATKAAADEAKAAAKAAKAAEKAAAAPAEAPANAGTACSVKVGRWTYEGRVIGRKGDELVVEYARNGKTVTADVVEDSVTYG